MSYENEHFLKLRGLLSKWKVAIACVVRAPLHPPLVQHTGLMSVGFCPVGSKKLKVFFLFLVAAEQKLSGAETKPNVKINQGSSGSSLLAFVSLCV